MTDALQQKIHIELLDLLDDVKFELTELNAQKGLYINGPANQLLKRGVHMAYVQGQKQAIDNIMTIVEQQLEDQHFLEHYDKFQNEVAHRNYDKTANFAELSDIPRQFDNFLDQFYQIKGQYFIITHINTLIGDFHSEAHYQLVYITLAIFSKTKPNYDFMSNIILHEIVTGSFICY